MDELDLRISHTLAEDGRMPNSEIARRLGVSEGTVRQRLRRLIEGGVLKIQTMVHCEKAPSLYPVIIGLKLEGRQLGRFARQLEQFPEVQRTQIVTGRYDLIVSILLDSHQRLVDFLTDKLWRLPGVRDTETFICLKNYDPWLPAACLVQGAEAGPNAGGNARRAPKAHRKKDGL
jgi:Lrp/AsnC family transcriptional regulator for asnA, asnC and gidA